MSQTSDTVGKQRLPSGVCAADSRGGSLREVAVESILGPHREAVLVHNGARYRLRITSNDKLILTK